MKIEELAKEKKEHAEESAKLTKQIQQTQAAAQTSASAKTSLTKLKAKL
jgi:hypothetical protein